MRKRKTANAKFLGLNPKNYVVANYVCACGTQFTSNEGLMMFCPDCGEIADSMPNKKVQASTIKGRNVGTCAVCASELFSDIDAPTLEKNKDSMFCPECGDSLVKANFDYEEDLDDYEEDLDDYDDLDDYEDDDDELDEDIYAAADEDDDDEDDEEDLIDEEDGDQEELDVPDEEEEEEDPEEDAEEDGDDDEDEDDEEDEPDEDENEDDDEEVDASTITASVIASVDDVRFDLWHSDGDILRNVTVAGVPVACIKLSKQDNPAQAQEVFAQDFFEDALKEQMLTEPVDKVLASVNATFFDYSEDDRKTMKEEVKAATDKKVNDFRAKFAETFLTVLAGTNKNFFHDVENTLKEGFWTALAEAGIEAPEAIIEEVFATGAEPFMEGVFSKTLDLLDKSEDTRQEIMAMVSDAQTVKPVIDKSLSSELAQASFNVTMPKTAEVKKKLSFRNKRRF